MTPERDWQLRRYLTCHGGQKQVQLPDLVGVYHAVPYIADSYDEVWIGVGIYFYNVHNEIVGDMFYPMFQSTDAPAHCLLFLSAMRTYLEILDHFNGLETFVAADTRVRTIQITIDTLLEEKT